MIENASSTSPVSVKFKTNDEVLSNHVQPIDMVDKPLFSGENTFFSNSTSPLGYDVKLDSAVNYTFALVTLENEQLVHDDSRAYWLKARISKDSQKLDIYVGKASCSNPHVHIGYMSSGFFAVIRLDVDIVNDIIYTPEKILIFKKIIIKINETLSACIDFNFDLNKSLMKVEKLSFV